MTDRPARIAAALIALSAWVGLAAGAAAVTGRTGSWAATAWVMLGYFTNTTGLLLAVLFTGIAAGARAFAGPRTAAAAALMMLLVGIVQRLLLHGLRPLGGGDAVADMLLHQLLPVATPLFWLVFVEKGGLKHRDPLIWAAYPLSFLAYALIRGGFTGHYPYPFVDVARFGWANMLSHVGAITAGFVAAGWALVALDRRLGTRSGRDLRAADEA